MMNHVKASIPNPPHPRLTNSKKHLGWLFAEGESMSTISALRVAEVLNHFDIPFVVVGGVVTGCWTGFPRSTKDVDAVVDAGVVNRRTLRTAVLKLKKGMKVDLHPSVTRFYESTPVGKRELIDFIKPYGELYTAVFKNSVKLTVRGVKVAIPTAEMLLAMKYAAMTSMTRSPEKAAQDRADFIAVARAQRRKLKLLRLRRLVNLVGSTLGEKAVALVRENWKRRRT